MWGDGQRILARDGLKYTWHRMGKLPSIAGWSEKPTRLEATVCGDCASSRLPEVVWAAQGAARARRTGASQSGWRDHLPLPPHRDTATSGWTSEYPANTRIFKPQSPLGFSAQQRRHALRNVLWSQFTKQKERKTEGALC